MCAGITARLLFALGVGNEFARDSPSSEQVRAGAPRACGVALLCARTTISLRSPGTARPLTVDNYRHYFPLRRPSRIDPGAEMQDVNSLMKRIFAAIVERTSKWDPAKPPQEQDGFALHVKYMGSLEAEGFIVVAGLLQKSNDVLFLFRAESETEVRRRLAEDPWQQDGHARLVRLEELNVRTGPAELLNRP